MNGFWGAVVASVLILGVPAPARDRGHPQDGPDVDLRVRIEAERVRVQAILNLAFCDEVVDAPRLNETELHESERGPLREALFELFREEVVLKVDGIRVDPAERSFEALPVDEDELTFFPIMGLLAATRVRLEMVYELKSPPRSVGLTWSLYPPNRALRGLVEVPIDVNAEWSAFGDVKVVPFHHEEPEFIWHATGEETARRFLAVPAAVEERVWRVPALSAAVLVLAVVGLLGAVVLGRARPRPVAVALVLAVGAGAAYLARDRAVIPLPSPFGASRDLPDPAEARRIFAALHGNVYRAFDFSEEEEIYDALARSVSGDLLDRIYNEVYKSLVLQEQGGAVCRVQRVEPLDSEVEGIGAMPPEDRPGFRVRARWRVTGQVYHWGHVHGRTNEYLADYVVTEEPSGWRISDSNMIEQVRIADTTDEGAVESGAR